MSTNNVLKKSLEAGGNYVLEEMQRVHALRLRKNKCKTASKIWTLTDIIKKMNRERLSYKIWECKINRRRKRGRSRRRWYDDIMQALKGKL